MIFMILHRTARIHFYQCIHGQYDKHERQTGGRLATYLEHASVKEGQALVKHGNGLTFLQLQGLLEVLHRCHVVLAPRHSREHKGQKPRPESRKRENVRGT